MKYLWPIVFLLSAWATREEQVAKILKENPQILFRAIEDHPDEFMASVQRAAQGAQMRQAEKREKEARQQMEEDQKHPKQPKLSDDRRLSGRKEAPNIIVEYADFQCPACGMAFESMRELKRKDGDRVQIYFKHVPLDFHPMAEPSARFYEAVRKLAPAKTQATYDYLFANQAKMRDPHFLQDAAKKIGVKYEAVSQLMPSKEIDAILAADRAEFEKFGFTGTPTFVVNGISLGGAQPVEEFERVMSLKK